MKVNINAAQIAITCETLTLLVEVIPRDLEAALYGDPLALDMFEADCERLALAMVKLMTFIENKGQHHG